MSKIWQIIFILIFSAYHLLRDISQIAGIHHPVVDIGHWPHQWCQPYCSAVTIPPEIFNLVASAVVLKRKRIGALGKFVLILMAIWAVSWLLP